MKPIWILALVGGSIVLVYAVKNVAYNSAQQAGNDSINNTEDSLLKTLFPFTEFQ